MEGPPRHYTGLPLARWVGRAINSRALSASPAPSRGLAGRRRPLRPRIVRGGRRARTAADGTHIILEPRGVVLPAHPQPRRMPSLLHGLTPGQTIDDLLCEVVGDERPIDTNPGNPAFSVLVRDQTAYATLIYRSTNACRPTDVKRGRMLNVRPSAGGKGGRGEEPPRPGNSRPRWIRREGEKRGVGGRGRYNSVPVWHRPGTGSYTSDILLSPARSRGILHSVEFGHAKAPRFPAPISPVFPSHPKGLIPFDLFFVLPSSPPPSQIW